VVALSICEVEYIAVATGACQAVWLARLLTEPRFLRHRSGASGLAEDWSIRSAMSVVSMASLWAHEVSLWADLDALDAVERQGRWQI
jgi:hypothetical protein